MRALEEKAALSTRMSEASVDPRMALRMREQAQDNRDHADIIRRIIFKDQKDEKDEKEKQLAG